MPPYPVHVKGQLQQQQPKKGIVTRGQAEVLMGKSRASGRDRRLCISIKSLGPALAVGTRACPSKPSFISFPLFRN